jgi:hypothetical protein
MLPGCPQRDMPLIILLPDQVHRRTCLYCQSEKKINYSLLCLYQHLSRHTGPQHFLVYCSVRMAKYFFITINSGQLNFLQENSEASFMTSQYNHI